MTAVPLPTSSAPGLTPQENGGLLVNAYAEKLSDGRGAWRRAPGLRELFEVSGRSHCRGFAFVNGVLYMALNDRAVAVTQGPSSYNVTDLGALPGTGPVTFARNNKRPSPDLVCVAEGVAYVIGAGTPPASYPDPDVNAPNAVTSISGYFVFTYGDAKAQASGLNETGINTLDFAFAESKPDGLSRPVTIGNDLLLCGTSTIEIWRNTGNAQGFPFSYLDTIPRGIASPWAIAGNEDEWANTIIFAGNDNIVYRLQGYAPQRISTHEVERMIEAVADKSTLRATVFMKAGHAFWALSSDTWTWVYDLTSGFWHQRASHGSDRWRATCAVKAFGMWVAGDLETGKVFAIEEDCHEEGGEPLTAVVRSLVADAFPDRAVIDRLDVNMATGLGVASGTDPTQTDPRISISWSNDGGRTFGSPVLREFGAQGSANRKPFVPRLGYIRARGLQVEIRCSDPVPFTLFGLDVVARKGAR